MILRELRKPLFEGKMTDDEIYGMLYHMVSKQGKDAKEIIKYIKGLKDPEYQKRQVGRQGFHDWVKYAQPGDQQSGKAFGRKVLVKILESKVLTEDRISDLLIDLGLNSDQVKDIFQKFGLSNNTINVGLLNKVKSFFDRKEPTDRDIAIKAAERDLAGLNKNKGDLRDKRKTQYDNDLDETGLGEKKDVPKIKMGLSERYDFRQFLQKIGLMDKINSLGLRIEDAKELFGDLQPRLYAKFSELRNSDNYPYNVGEEINSIEQGLNKFIRRFGGAEAGAEAGAEDEELDLEEDLPEDLPDVKEIPPKEAAEELAKLNAGDPTQGVFEKYVDPSSKEEMNKRKREQEEKVETEDGISYKPFVLEDLSKSINVGNIEKFVRSTYDLNNGDQNIRNIFDFVKKKLSELTGGLNRIHNADFKKAYLHLRDNELKGALDEVPKPELDINEELLDATISNLSSERIKKFIIDVCARNGTNDDVIKAAKRYLILIFNKLKSEGYDLNLSEYNDGIAKVDKWREEQENGVEEEE